MAATVKVKRRNKHTRLWQRIDQRFVLGPRLAIDISRAATFRPDDDDPHQLAKQILDRHYTYGEASTLRFYRARWYHWNGTCYYPIPAKEMRARTNKQLRGILDDTPSVKKVVRQVVENVLQALEGYCLVEGAREMPCWLGEDSPPVGRDLLAMENGLLDVEAAMHGRRNCLHDPTPLWFSVTHLPYGYDPKAWCPKWIKFLEQVCPDVMGRFLLQEFIGYCLVFDTSFHKALIMIGEGANGKSVVTMVFTQVLGPGNVSHVGLDRFGDRFAMAPTIGCLANIVSETPSMKGVAEDILKAFISGDQIRVEFKYQDPTDAYPTARLIVATNGLPQFCDRTEGIWRRLLIIPFTVTIPEAEQDRELAAKICREELSGLLNWAVKGLKRLHERRRFTVPKSSRELVEEHRSTSNPARHYLKTHYDLAPGHDTLCEQVYSAYQRWCNGENARPLNRQQFGREVRRVFPTVKRKQLRTRTSGPRLYHYAGLRAKKTR